MGTRIRTEIYGFGDRHSRPLNYTHMKNLEHRARLELANIGFADRPIDHFRLRCELGSPGRTRTYDILINSQTLLPTELQGNENRNLADRAGLEPTRMH